MLMQGINIPWADFARCLAAGWAIGAYSWRAARLPPAQTLPAARAWTGFCALFGCFAKVRSDAAGVRVPSLARGAHATTATTHPGSAGADYRRCRHTGAANAARTTTNTTTRVTAGGLACGLRIPRPRWRRLPPLPPYRRRRVRAWGQRWHLPTRHKPLPRSKILSPKDPSKRRAGGGLPRGRAPPLLSPPGGLFGIDVP